MTELYQLFYKEEQKEKLYHFAIPYKTEGLTVFFENYWIRQLVWSTQAEKIGVTSWKLADKMRMRVGLREPLTQHALNSDYDVLSLTKNSLKHTMLAHLYQWHPKSKETMALLWQKLGLKLPGEVKNPIYQNHHCTKTEIYKDYVKNFLNPAMELTLSDEELNNLMLQPSGYGKLSRGADMKSVKAKLGLDDYPLAPFILERCFSCYAQVKGYKITYL
jgi:hypothetical protein